MVAISEQQQKNPQLASIMPETAVAHTLVYSFVVGTHYINSKYSKYERCNDGCIRNNTLCQVKSRPFRCHGIVCSVRKIFLF